MEPELYEMTSTLPKAAKTPSNLYFQVSNLQSIILQEAIYGKARQV